MWYAELLVAVWCLNLYPGGIWGGERGGISQVPGYIPGMVMQ
jgi:hypothetical protein